ncbi:MAG: M28 family peptidase [Bacteroidetes bacterium]|nr:M28 family peptidase [Bacteroidota bacterium]HET6244752.1 M28 family peptidase [Bacteroidia bacterium]
MKIVITFLVFSSCSFAINAQDLGYAKKLVNILAAPDMFGRGYVSNGDKIAADFIKNEFVKLDLLSFNEDYFQSFSLEVNTFPTKLSFSANDKMLIPGKDFLVLPFSGTDTGTYKTIYFDTKIWNNKRKLERFKKSNLSDKYIILDDSNAASEIEKEVFKSALTNPFKAKGIIKLTDNKLTWSVSQTEAEYVAFEVLRTEFPSKTKKIDVHVENKYYTDYSSQNVIGYIKGNSKPDSFIVFTAHYDHLGHMGKNTYFPGANDNASGIAVITDLASHYSRNPSAYSIVFIAFSAEEAGLIGSRYYTQNPLFPLSNIRFLINLDLLGNGEQGITVVNGSEYKEEFLLLNKINDRNNYLTKINERGKAANSDHYYFSEKGVRCFFIYTLGENKAYHDINDKAENVKFPAYDEIFRLLTDFTGSLTSSPEHK